MTEKEYWSIIGYEMGENPFSNPKDKAKFDKYFATAKKLIGEQLKKDREHFSFEDLAKILFTTYPDKECQDENLPFTINIVKAILIMHYPTPEEAEKFFKAAAEWDDKVAQIKAGKKDVQLDLLNQPRRPIVTVANVIRDIMRYISFAFNEFSDCERKNPKLAKHFGDIMQDLQSNFERVFIKEKKSQELFPNFFVSFFEQTHNKCKNLGGVATFLSQYAVDDCSIKTKDSAEIDLGKMFISIGMFYLWLEYKNRTDWCQMNGTTLDQQAETNIIKDDGKVTIYGGADSDDDDE